jgi:hypothetical protein
MSILPTHLLKNLYCYAARQARLCKHGYASTAMRPLLCGHGYATTAMRPRLCKHSYATTAIWLGKHSYVTTAMQPLLCNHCYATTAPHLGHAPGWSRLNRGKSGSTRRRSARPSALLFLRSPPFPVPSHTGHRNNDSVMATRP